MSTECASANCLPALWGNDWPTQRLRGMRSDTQFPSMHVPIMMRCRPQMQRQSLLLCRGDGILMQASMTDILLRKWLKLKFLYDCIGKRSQLLPLLLLFNLCGCYWGAKQWRMFKDLSFVLVVNSCTLWRFSVVSPLQHSCSSLDHFFMTSSLAPQVQHCACPGDDILSPCLTTFIISLYHP